MHSRWFNVAVVILWLAAMTWLVKYKVLPPLLVGQPPSYRTILQAQRREPPVGWKMSFNDRPMGWALSSTSQLPDRLTEIRSRVHFDQIPLEQLTPGWLRALVRFVERPVGNLQMDAQNTMLIDPLGRLSGFKTEVRVEPFDDLIKMQGTVEGTQLELHVHTGGLEYEAKVYLPQDGLLNDALSPRTQLPGLRVGQTWRVPIYSPLRPPSNPMEILQATVEVTQPIVWDGRMEEAFVVVYRSDSGFGLGSDDNPRGKLWVRRDGTVLKQQVMIFNSTMTFVRLPDDQAAALETYVNGNGSRNGPI